MDNKFLLIKYYNKDLKLHECEQVEAWLSESPENKKEYEGIIKIWNDSRETSLLNNVDINRDWKELLNIHYRNSGSVKSFVQIYKIAASIFLIIGISSLLYWQVNKNRFVSITNNSCNLVKIIILEDGSEVSLNYNATIKYPEKFKEEERLISLTGEAFFKVREDTSAPFKVELHRGEVEVLGTSFNVKSTAAYTTVSVESGKVKLTDKNKSFVLLDKGFEGKVTSSKLSKQTISNKNYLSWKSGHFNFTNTGLEQVFEDLVSKYHFNYEFSDQLLKNRKLTAEFENESLDHIISIIELSCEVEIVKESGFILIKSE